MRTSIQGLAVAVLVLAGCGGDSGPTAPVDTTVASVAVSAPSNIVVIGSTLQLTVAPKNAGGTVITGLSATWASSNQAVATVSSTGLVSGLVAGSVTITATVNGIAGTKSLASATAAPSATVDASASLEFSPAQVDIVAGGSVTWNFGSVAHNVTFNSTASGTPANTTDLINTTATRTFPTAGSFPYHCTIHAGMNGTVIVH